MSPAANASAKQASWRSSASRVTDMATLTTHRFGKPVRYSSSHRQQDTQVVLGQLVAPTECGDLEQRHDTDHVRARPPQDLPGGRGGPAGGDHVVDDEHAVTRLDGVDVHFEG